MPSAPRQPSLKAAIYDQIARIGRATAAPRRLELLDLLAQGPRTVEALAVQTGSSVATTSHHLQVLRRVRLVEAGKSGVYVTYRIADPAVGHFVLDLRRLAEARLSEIRQITREYLEARYALEPIGDGELVRRVRAGQVTLVDVRPREEYLAAHLPGALSVPLPDLPRKMRTLPARRDVVAYCRGPYCVMALDAVDQLRRRGFRAFRLDQGVAEWRARGWRLDAGGEDAAKTRARA